MIDLANNSIKNSDMDKSNDSELLTGVIPIGNVNGNLQSLYAWVNRVDEFPLKLILVHDIFDEQTSAALVKFMYTYKNLNIQLISGTFGSPGIARNAGLEIVNSEWTAFWDCDDKPCLDAIFSAINDSNMEDEVLLGGFLTNNVFSNEVNTNHAVMPSLKTVAMNPGIWRMIFRSRALGKLRFTNLKLAEDHVFASEMRLAERRIGFFPKSFYEYSIGVENQLTSKKTNLVDLQIASRIIFYNTNKKIDRNLIYFNMVLIIRQQFTLLKSGNMLIKFGVLKYVFKFIARAKPHVIWLSLKAFLHTVINWKKSKLS